ncbi:MAG TPA: hypothetical protein VGV64_04130, partial [Thermoplasmata archaeon]|nr:hypothetical protein [Thermoplasmata archaeon]
SHILHLTVNGTMTLANSSITTTVNVLDPFPSLSVAIAGTFTMSKGALAFPGQILVNGSSAALNLDQVSVQPNPSVALLKSNATGLAAQVLYNATRFAPSIWVTNGAHATLTASSESGTFRAHPSRVVPFGLQTESANTSVLAQPTSAPTFVAVSAGSTSSTALALDNLYPSVAGGYVNFTYNQTGSTHSTAGWSFSENGVLFPFAQIDFTRASGNVSIPLPAAAIGAINAAGLPTHLAWLSEGLVGVDLGATSGTDVTIHAVAVHYLAPVSYNVTVSGPGSTFTAANTVLDLNWNATPGLSGAPAYQPWNSTKLVLLNGAEAFLANLSVPYSVPTDFTHQSVVVPDALSGATFYRWLEMPVQGAGGLPVVGGLATAYSSYAGPLNVTVHNLNALSTADPDLARYVASWDAAQKVPYGGVNASTGLSTLLLADASIAQATLPDGTYLGAYHVGIGVAPPSTLATQWAYESLTPYPTRVSVSGGNVTGPDVGPLTTFPSYNISIRPAAPEILVNGTTDSRTIAIGEPLTIRENVTNFGIGAAANFNATLFYHEAGVPLPIVIGPAKAYGPLAPSASRTVLFNWTANETVVGIH